eukprot:SAG31_NODE_35777_length_320_cov_0.628959_1_plen_29_part_01
MPVPVRQFKFKLVRLPAGSGGDARASVGY